MSVERGRHEAWEELISASVTGDLTAAEHRRLEAHLASCASCQATFEAFDDGRRVVAGLRHVAPPRDLGARVRAGIEAGAFSSTPWWRRPPAIFAGLGGSLAVVAGVLLALVLVNDGRPDPNVGQATPTPLPSTSEAPATPEPTSSIAPSTPTPTVGPVLPPPATPGPSTTPDPAASPTPAVTPPALAASPEPDLYLALTGPADNQVMAVREGETGDEVGQVTTDEAGTPGEPVAAVLSADGRWLATITRTGLSGTQQVNVTRLSEPAVPDEPATPSAEPTPAPPETPVAEGTTLLLGEGRAGSPFLDRLTWSTDNRFLAFTLAGTDEDGTDAWVFDVTSGETTRLTETGSAYAGSFVVDEGAQALWISTAAEEPVSRLVRIGDEGPEPVDLEEVDEEDTVRNVFQPVVSPNDAFAIFWRGRMTLVDGQWEFESGGAPWLSEHRRDERGAIAFPSDRELFRDLVIDRDAFASAAVTWGPGGYTFAVWDATWTGLPQTDEGRYPDPATIYYGAITDGGLTRESAIEGALPQEGSVVDVKISPTGRHLLVTVSYPVDGDLDPPMADLLLVERDFDGEPDGVRRVNQRTDGWFGPAAFSERWSNTDEAP